MEQFSRDRNVIYINICTEICLLIIQKSRKRRYSSNKMHSIICILINISRANVKIVITTIFCLGITLATLLLIKAFLMDQCDLCTWRVYHFIHLL